MSELVLKEFTIGASHTIRTAPYESFKVEAQITCGSKIGCTEEEFAHTLTLAQARLKDILRDTYKSQKPAKLKNETEPE